MQQVKEAGFQNGLGLHYLEVKRFLDVEILSF
jgi:hypothetical protein